MEFLCVPGHTAAKGEHDLQAPVALSVRAVHERHSAVVCAVIVAERVPGRVETSVTVKTLVAG